jgi:hypothetical protein
MSSVWNVWTGLRANGNERDVELHRVGDAEPEEARDLDVEGRHCNARCGLAAERVAHERRFATPLRASRNAVNGQVAHELKREPLALWDRAWKAADRRGIETRIRVTPRLEEPLAQGAIASLTIGCELTEVDDDASDGAAMWLLEIENDLARHACRRSDRRKEAVVLLEEHLVHRV